MYPHGEKLTRENVEEAFNEESPAVSLSSEVFSDREITVNSNSPLTPNPKLFIGGATETEAENMIGFCGFVVYYRMPEDGTMQFSLPLMLAYRFVYSWFEQMSIFHIFTDRPKGIISTSPSARANTMILIENWTEVCFEWNVTTFQFILVTTVDWFLDSSHLLLLSNTTKRLHTMILKMVYWRHFQ